MDRIVLQAQDHLRTLERELGPRVVRAIVDFSLVIDLLDNLIDGLEVLQNCPMTFERFYRIAGELLFEALLLTFAVAGEVALGSVGN